MNEDKIFQEIKEKLTNGEMVTEHIVLTLEPLIETKLITKREFLPVSRVKLPFNLVDMFLTLSKEFGDTSFLLICENGKFQLLKSVKSITEGGVRGLVDCERLGRELPPDDEPRLPTDGRVVDD